MSHFAGAPNIFGKSEAPALGASNYEAAGRFAPAHSITDLPVVSVKSASGLVRSGDVDPATSTYATPQTVTSEVAGEIAAMLATQSAKRASILDDSKAITRTLQFQHTFKVTPGKTMTESEVKIPIAVLNKAFDHEIAFEKEPVYVLAASIDRGTHSTAPAQMDWTLHGIEGTTIQKVFTNENRNGVTLSLAPRETLTQAHEIFRMSNVDEGDLIKYGAIDIEAEAQKAKPFMDTGKYSIAASSFLGEVIVDNLPYITSNHELEWMPTHDAFLCSKAVLSEIVADFKRDVASKLKKTNFATVKGVLTRGDRTAEQMQTGDLADMSDAPGMGNAAALQAANKSLHTVTVNATIKLLHPKLLKAAADAKKFTQ